MRHAAPSLVLAAGLAVLGCGDGGGGQAKPETPAERSAGTAPAARADGAGEAAAAFARGLELAEAGDHEAAFDAYRETLRRDPDHLEARLALGRGLVATARVSAGRGGEAPGDDGGITLGRDEAVMAEAIEQFEQALELAPEDVEVRYWAGRALHVAGEDERALVQLREAVARDPEHGAAWKRIGLIHLDRGELAEARDALRTAEPLLPRDPGVPFQLGNVLVEEDPEGARDAFRRSVAIDPSFASSYNALVGVLARLGDLEGAEAARADFERWRFFESRVRAKAQEALAAPEDVALQTEAGELYLVKRGWEDALAFFARGLAVDPTDPQLHVYSGTALLALGELERARDHMEEAIFHAPSALEPRLELIRVLVAQEDEPRLAEILGEIRGAAGSLDVSGHLGYADFLLGVGLPAEAAATYRAVLERDPENEAAREGLARATSAARATDEPQEGGA